MIKLYNSLTKQNEELKPITPGLVKMYTCGLTVYSNPHIGNMRAYIFMDILRRVLKYNGLEIDGVMNIGVPTFRATKDISNKADIVEEITRVYGYDNIDAEQQFRGRYADGACPADAVIGRDGG